jgi:hypothetical protein
MNVQLSRRVALARQFPPLWGLTRADLRRAMNAVDDADSFDVLPVDVKRLILASEENSRDLSKQHTVDDSTIAASAFHLPGTHNQKTHGHGHHGSNGFFASAAEREETLVLARKKVVNAPRPTAEAVAKAQAELRAAREGRGRAGGESRGGSAAARRRQRENLFREFGGDKRGYAVCHGCGLKLHYADPGTLVNQRGYARLERGKIFVKCQGGGYQLANLLPECFGCNRHRGDYPVRIENKC